MVDFRGSKNFQSTGTATDGYDVYVNRTDGADIILSKDVNDLADSIAETQKALLDGYATTDLLPQAVSFEDGQTLVYDSGSSKMVAGASGDASFKIQSITTPSALIKSGFMMLDDGRELRITSDLAINLSTILGGMPAASTSYYLYLDLNSLSASTTTAAGREVHDITEADFALDTVAPSSKQLSRFAPLGVIKSSAVPDWSGDSFETLAFRRHESSIAMVQSPVAYITSATDATGLTTFAHNMNIPVDDQNWIATLTTSGGLSTQLDAAWIVDMNTNDIDVDFTFLSAGDTVNIKLENTGLAGGLALPTKGYDSGLIGADVLDALLPISHGMVSTPTAMVLLQEVAPGELEMLDVGSFMSATSTELKGDLASLTTTKVRLVANIGAEAVRSAQWNTRIITASSQAYVSDEMMVDSSTAVTVTLPANPASGDRVMIQDMTSNAGTNNITITAAQNIDGAAGDFVLNADDLSIEMIYCNVSVGWKTRA